MMARLRRIIRTLRLRGLRYLFALPRRFLWPRTVGWALYEFRFASFVRRLMTQKVSRARSTTKARATETAPHRTESSAGSSASAVSAHAWLPEKTLSAALRLQAEQPEEPVVLGRIDNDGRVLPLCGPLPDFEPVDAESFVERYRYGLELVLVADAVLIAKDYRGDRAAFERERRSLEALRSVTGCPELHKVDEKNLVLTKSFVNGATLRDHLVTAGARILSIETDGDTDLADLDPAARLEAVWARGREVFPALPGQLTGFVETLVQRLDAMHRRGVTGFSMTFGNIVLREPSGDPWLIDFDAADIREPKGWLFRIRRDRDRAAFNNIYGQELLTEPSARALLKRISTPYSPVDLGGGLAGRGFWSVDSGTGRWEFLNRDVLGGLVAGRRVLDLGSYNALMPLSMLADGAAEVVAAEKSPENVENARQLQRLFEWRDMRPYKLTVRQADMRAILEEDWGDFGIVTAFCSLYYLSAEDMARVVRRSAQLAPVMVLQAKTDTRSEAADDKARKSSIAFLRALLEENGFPNVEQHAPAGYSRPLLIGRR